MISDLVIYRGTTSAIKYGSVCQVCSCSIDRKFIVVRYYNQYATLPVIQFENIP